MNRSDRYHCIFFHVPRNGGSSIESLDWWDQWSGHVRACETPRPAGYLSFAFVRNPWDRFVSLYHYFASMRPGHRWYHANVGLAKAVQRFHSFTEFCRSFHAWPYRGNFHFRPQHYWITDGDRQLLVDFLGHYERLQRDFSRICRRVGAPEIILPHLNGSKHGPYAAYYDQETCRIVEQLYHQDIELFDYTMVNHQS